jgi:hypothetical protein
MARCCSLIWKGRGSRLLAGPLSNLDMGHATVSLVFFESGTAFHRRRRHARITVAPGGDTVAIP